MKILVYPKDTNNPYQKLLYGEISKTNTVTYFSFPTKSKIGGLILFFPKIIWLRLQGYTIFHIHWLYELGFIFKIPLLAFLSQLFFFLYSLKFITILKVLGFKVVWTVHNVSTHEKQTLNDAFISKYLAFCSNALIVHSYDTIAQLKKIGIEHNAIVVIPHGNYIGYYENSISKTEAQKKLAIGKNFTFLYFGQIRSYKGVDTLIDTFEKVHTENSQTQLIVAGQCNDSTLKDKIEMFQKKYPESLYFFSNYIKDNEIQNYFNAADCVVIPFKRSTTSGSVLLALTFSKPIVYPGIGNMVEFPETIGFRYKVNDIKTFEQAMNNAFAEKEHLKTYEKNAFEFTKQFNWEIIQKKTLELYRSL